jgi:cytochrome P450
VFQALSPRFNYLSADINFELWCQQRFNKALQDPGIYNSHSLVRHLLELKDNDIDMQYIAAEVLDNINAAEATVAVTATYLIWKLTETPRWQSIIRQELMDLTKQNDKTLSFADIDSQVPSLEACLREVYRLYPASSGRAERMVPAGGRNLLGVHLPENTTVTTSVLALHHDMEVYPNPSSFAPERWLEGDKDLLKTMEAQLIPFGYGGRICLGKALATMEIKVLMATLYLEHESLLTEATNAASMAQCSTHDAVPKALKCVVKFRKVMR